jgi:hypothetical protein
MMIFSTSRQRKKKLVRSALLVDILEWYHWLIVSSRLSSKIPQDKRKMLHLRRSEYHNGNLCWAESLLNWLCVVKNTALLQLLTVVDVVFFRDKKGRRDKKGQTGTQNGCTSPSHDSNEADAMPVIETPVAHSVRSLVLFAVMRA